MHSQLCRNYLCLQRLTSFLSLFQRSLYAQYEEDVQVKGIPGYRFSPPSQVFANQTVNPANAGFCVPAGNCLGSGVLNVSLCKQGRRCTKQMFCMKNQKIVCVTSRKLFHHELLFSWICSADIFHGVILTESFVCLGAPIIMSSPHFYQADEKFVQDIFGMKPKKEQHQTAIDINPVGTWTLFLKDPLQTGFKTVW